MAQEELVSEHRAATIIRMMALLGLSLYAQSALAVRYVSMSGSDSANDCLSSSAPCATIQAAVDAASSGEEIRVASGTYSGSATEIVDRGGEDHDYRQVVYIDKPLSLKGGYSEPDWTTYDPDLNPTTIDALQDGRPVTIVDTGNEIVTLQGLILTGGNYTGLGNPAEFVNNECRDPGGSDCGGGLYVYSSAFEIIDSSVVDNVASSIQGDGGGVYLYRARSSSIINTVISGNTTANLGGGLYVTRQNHPLLISETAFETNAAQSGGGARFSSNIEALVRIEDSAFSENRAEGGAGGALYANLTADGLILLMQRVVVENNVASSQGKGVYIAAAGPVTPEVRLENVLFVGNQRTAAVPETARDAVLAVASNFTNLRAELLHVTAVDNPVPNFLYTKPDEPGRFVEVTAYNVLIAGVENAWSAEETDTGEATLTNHNSLYHDVTNQTATFDGQPTFVTVDPVVGDPVLDAGYEPQGGSPAIDAGIEVGVHRDLENTFRPQGEAPDIGAYEVGGGRIFADNFESDDV